MFHMEHCVFCAVLSPGTNKTNCGRPCDTLSVTLRDRIGVEHPLTADVGCRNTLYNAVAQSGAEVVPSLLSKGIRHFRIELLDEKPDAIAEVIRSYVAIRWPFSNRLNVEPPSDVLSTNRHTEEIDLDRPLASPRCWELNTGFLLCRSAFFHPHQNQVPDFESIAS